MRFSFRQKLKNSCFNLAHFLLVKLQIPINFSSNLRTKEFPIPRVNTTCREALSEIFGSCTLVWSAGTALCSILSFK